MLFHPILPHPIHLIYNIMVRKVDLLRLRCLVKVLNVMYSNFPFSRRYLFDYAV